MNSLNANLWLAAFAALTAAAAAGCFVFALAPELQIYIERQREELGRYIARQFQRDRTPDAVLRGQWLAIALLFLLGFLASGLLLAMILALLAFFAPALGRRVALKRRAKKFDEQLVDALVAIANAFKARPTLSEALAVVNENMVPPISEEFGLLLNEFRLGVTIDEGLEKMSRRMENPNLSMAINAMQIARTTGGNMSQILDEIAGTIREIKRLQGVVDTMTAQGRLQATVIGAMPFVLGLAFYAVQPDLITPLFQHPVGYAILAIQAVLWLAALVILRKIITINV